jgi:RimJ/RimL family protein N-acetyltransferase
MTSNVNGGLRLMRSGTGRRRLWEGMRVRLYWRSEAIGLCRDVSVPFAAPPAKVPVTVRPVRPDDDLSFIADVPELPAQAAEERAYQRSMLNADIPTCWIAVDSDGTACYMQWLISARDNPRIQEWWRGLMPELRPDEALLEGAYTADSHRGKGIMAHAMALIAEQARDIGAQKVITFVSKDNIASLKGCERAGFAPHLDRRESWTLFRRRVRFQPLT